MLLHKSDVSNIYPFSNDSTIFVYLWKRKISALLEYFAFFIFTELVKPSIRGGANSAYERGGNARLKF